MSTTSGTSIGRATAVVDLLFRLDGERLPTDHAYALYAALSRVVPSIHADGAQIRFAPINGDRGGKGVIRLFERSRLRIRVPVPEIGSVLGLAGQTLDVGGHAVRLKVPEVVPLRSVTALRSKVVTYKNVFDPVVFLDITRHRLAEMRIQGEPGIPLVGTGKYAGEPRRQVLRMKGRALIGYALLVEGLAAHESLLLQEQGIGTHRRIGCGFFLPLEPRFP